MTEQNKHTRGPWTASGWTIRDGAGTIVGRANSDYLSDAALNPECLACAEEEEVREQGPGQREASANARLIAAAPALSGAARSAASSIRDYLSGEWDGSPEGWEAVLRRLDAAIAQAEGAER